MSTEYVVVKITALTDDLLPIEVIRVDIRYLMGTKYVVDKITTLTHDLLAVEVILVDITP